MILCSVFQVAFFFLVALVRHCHWIWTLPGSAEPDGEVSRPLRMQRPVDFPHLTGLTVYLAGPMAINSVWLTLRTWTSCEDSLPWASTALTVIVCRPIDSFLAPCQSRPTCLSLARSSVKLRILSPSAANVMRLGPPLLSCADAVICSEPEYFCPNLGAWMRIDGPSKSPQGPLSVSPEVAIVWNTSHAGLCAPPVVNSP